MLGTSTGWRAQDRDALQDPDLHRVLLLADVLSPWTVGRFKDLEQLKRHTEAHGAADIVWAQTQAMDYMPVIVGFKSPYSTGTSTCMAHKGKYGIDG